MLNREKMSVSDYYESKVKFRELADKRRKGMRVILKAKDVKFTKTSMSHGIAYLVSPYNGFDMHSIETFIAEVPPMGHSGMHRHNVEAAIYILEGKGYSIIDDEKYEWEKGDSICVPPMAWHQHFNTSKKKPVRYLAATTVTLLSSIGVMNMEQKEDRGTI